MSEEIAQTVHDLAYYRALVHDLNNQLAAEQARRLLAEADAAALRRLYDAVTALPDAAYEPGCDCPYCADIDAALFEIRNADHPGAAL